nr:collectin-12-like [Taeniopygia guttata]
MRGGAGIFWGSCDDGVGGGVGAAGTLSSASRGGERRILQGVPGDGGKRSILPGAESGASSGGSRGRASSASSGGIPGVARRCVERRERMRAVRALPAGAPPVSPQETGWRPRAGAGGGEGLTGVGASRAERCEFRPLSPLPPPTPPL